MLADIWQGAFWAKAVLLYATDNNLQPLAAKQAWKLLAQGPFNNYDFDCDHHPHGVRKFWQPLQRPLVSAHDFLVSAAISGTLKISKEFSTLKFRSENFHW